jgi:hypothetical protein
MAEPTAAFVIEDWTASSIPPPLLALSPTQPRDQYIAVVTGGQDVVEGATVRRLTPTQALALADELRARALMIDPSLAGAAAPQPPNPEETT